MVPLRPGLAGRLGAFTRAFTRAVALAVGLGVGIGTGIGIVVTGPAVAAADDPGATGRAVPRPDPAPTRAYVPAVGDLVDRWLQHQAGVRTWSAGFVQTRTLKTLAQPLTARGRVRFAAPNRFHWEIGDPVQSMAVRQSNAVLIVYPPLRRAERYPLDAAASGPWKPMLTLLEAGFPESRAQLDERFRVVSLTDLGNDTHELALEPRTASVRRLMPRFRIVLGGSDLAVRATEMVFADGSALRNDFHDAAINPVLEDSLFEPVLGPDFKITEPLARPRP